MYQFWILCNRRGHFTPVYCYYSCLHVAWCCDTYPEDAGENSTNFGQLVIAGATLGEFGSIILISFFFSSEITSPFTKATFLGIFAILIFLISLVIFGVHRATWFMKMLQRFQDSSSQISVRFALTLLVGFVTPAYGFGAEAILGAFLAGVAFRSVYKETTEIRPLLRAKLEAIGFGFFVPIFSSQVV